MERTSRPWSVPASVAARRTRNPIRAIVDNLNVPPDPNKPLISLGIGDPTIFGNFDTASQVNAAIVRSLQSGQFNGYPPSVGYERARAAIASQHTLPSAPLTAKDVVIASGCSGALEICITAIASEGQNILLPRPGFSIYQAIANSKGIECRLYDLLPDRSWEVDLAHVESLVDDKTAAIIINNPSNPCGSVYSESHLRDILALCEKYRVPVIADEIYCDMVFSGHKFFPLASLSETVPVVAVGGLAKKYLVPGWRLGWILVHDRNGLLGEIRGALTSLSQLVLGANSIVQGALEEIFNETPASFYEETNKKLEEHADLCASMLSKIPGLRVVIPQGAMYMMVEVKVAEFKDIVDDVDFASKLVREEAVVCLPAQCFQYPNFFRIVITAPKDKLEIAFSRMAEFCKRHHV